MPRRIAGGGYLIIENMLKTLNKLGVVDIVTIHQVLKDWMRRDIEQLMPRFEVGSVKEIEDKEIEETEDG